MPVNGQDTSLDEIAYDILCAVVELRYSLPQLRVVRRFDATYHDRGVKAQDWAEVIAKVTNVKAVKHLLDGYVKWHRAYNGDVR